MKFYGTIHNLKTKTDLEAQRHLKDLCQGMKTVRGAINTVFKGGKR